MPKPDDRERRDELALTSQEAAVAVVAAVAAAEVGPAGAVIGALLGPFASLAAKRLRELVRSIEGEIDPETLAARLEENERLAQMVAEVVRGTTESDLAAKRRLLARAAVNALKDDAVVDDESILVRAANSVSTVDIRVLVRTWGPGGEFPPRPVPRTWFDWEPTESGIGLIFAPAVSSLESAGLVLMVPEKGREPRDPDRLTWIVSHWGHVFLERLLEEGLADELSLGMQDEDAP